MDYTLHHGDCLEVMATMADNSVDAVVTDPPYGLSFMGKNWDHGVPGEAFWREALRVAKPGAHLLAFGGTRTFHRLAVAIEDAGWEIRDTVIWCYGSGFPKSLDVSKAIDRAAGAEREVVGSKVGLPGYSLAVDKGRGVACVAHGNSAKECEVTAPATSEAQQWQGWGTALKPAWEPVIVARKPLEGTVAANVLKYGTGAINVDGCRVEAVEGRPLIISHGDGFGSGEHVTAYGNGLSGSRHGGTTTTGRWPANLIISYNEDEYKLRETVTPQQLKRLSEWLCENT
jgi:site-specific DNA-methyltransferase (adenine-specific)